MSFKGKDHFFAGGSTFPSLSTVKVPLLHHSAFQLTPAVLPFLVLGHAESHRSGSFCGESREINLSSFFFKSRKQVSLSDSRSL